MCARVASPPPSLPSQGVGVPPSPPGECGWGGWGGGGDGGNGGNGGSGGWASWSILTAFWVRLWFILASSLGVRRTFWLQVGGSWGHLGSKLEEPSAVKHICQKLCKTNYFHQSFNVF